MLAKRLVGQLSASDDYEESMISKLKVLIFIVSIERYVLFFSQYFFVLAYSKHVVSNTHRNYSECFKT